MHGFIEISKATFLTGFNVNRKKGNQKSSFLMLGIFGVLSLGFSFFYHFSIITSLPEMGMEFDDYIIVTLMTGSMLTLMTGFFQMQNSIFKTKDYEFLESLPINKKVIVASKIFAVYLMNLFEDIIIVLPGLIYYLAYGGGILQFILCFISMFFVSLIPLLLSSLIGTLVAYITAKTKYKNLVTIISYLLLFIAIFAISFLIGQSVGTGTSTINASSLPYFILLRDSFLPGQIYKFFLFLLIHIVALVLVVLFISLVYSKINSLITTFNAHEDYVVGKSNNTLSYNEMIKKKEWNMVMKRPLYLINSYLGPILFLIISIFEMITFATILPEIALEGEEEVRIFLAVGTSIIVMMGMLMNSMMSSTTASFSLEGQNMELLYAYPINPKDVIKEKLMMGIKIPVILNLICSTIISIVYSILFGFDIVTIIGILVIPPITSILTAYVGMLCGMRWPKIHFENEMQVMKNSASANLTMLFVALPTMILAFIYMAFTIVAMEIDMPVVRLYLTLVIISIYVVAIFIVSKVLEKHQLSLFNKIREK